MLLFWVQESQNHQGYLFAWCKRAIKFSNQDSSNKQLFSLYIHKFQNCASDISFT